MSSHRLRRFAPYAGLVALALSLRWVGLDWGFYHPDEWPIDQIANRLDAPSSLGEFFSADSPLNPGWFNYGTLPLILLAAIGWLSDQLREVLDFIPSRAAIWRGAMGLADAATVVLVAHIGREIYGRGVGFLAAALYALAVLPIQLSHYFTVDPLMSALLTGSLLASIHFIRSRNPTTGYIAAALLGLAFSTKATALVFSVPVAVAWLLYLWGPIQAKANADAIRSALRHAVWAVLIGFAAFAVAQPYALIDFSTYFSDVLTQTNMARGTLDLPFTIQYEETTPWFYYLRHLVIWGLGIPLGVAALAGMALVVWRIRRERNVIEILLFLSLLVPFLWLGAQQVKFMRYLLPLYPLLCIAAALAILSAMSALERFGRRGVWLGTGLAGIVVVPTVFYALAFTTVFTGAHTVDRISAWITANVPDGSRVTVETWDQRFHGEYNYATIPIEVYWPDNLQKAGMLAGQIYEADYIYMFSNRGYGSVSRLPERFPVMRTYYERLFDGSLGFELERVEASYPSLLGITLAEDTVNYLGFDPVSPDVRYGAESGLIIDLGMADESFTVYERPKPMLFRKTTVLEPPELLNLLSENLPMRQSEFQGMEAPALLLSPDLADAQNERGTWTDMLPVTGRGSGTEFIIWLLAVQAIALAGFPLMTRIFRPLPDAGYLMGKALSLLIVSFIVWIGAALHIIPFSRTSVLAAILLLAAVSAVVAYQSRRELLNHVRLRWRWILTAEMIFLLAFVAFTLLRAANPDLWHPFRGGEKPMDVSYLTAITRSSFMPPYDPWFAGGHLNYYYFGHFIVATLIRLTGAVPEFAVNLAIPTFWALTVGAAFSLGVNLSEATMRRLRTQRFLSTSALLTGLFAAFMVAIAGNLDGFVQTAERIGPVAWDTLTGQNPGGLDYLLSVTTSTLSGEGFDYWRSSRMVAIPGSISITEFPFFSYLFADPHAHVFAMPFVLVSLGLSLAVALAIYERRTRMSVALPFLALALTLGALFAAHSWDYPTYLVIAVAAIGAALIARGTALRDTVLWTVAAAALLVGASFALFAPYHASNMTFYTEIVASNEQTPIRSVFAIFGLPMLIIVFSLRPAIAAALGLPHAGLRDLRNAIRLQVWPAGDSSSAFLARAANAAVGVALIVGVLTLFVMGYANVAMSGALACLTFALALSARLPFTIRLAYAASAFAFALIAAVDIVAVQDYLVRMNTIFRVYLQAWIVLGISAAFLLWAMAAPSGTLRMPGIGRVYRVSFFSLLAVLILGVSIYPVLGTRARLADRFDTTIPLTLDGTAYMQDSSYTDVWGGTIELQPELDALLWLRENVEGIPVVAEAGLPHDENNTPYFRIQSRAAMYAGLPVIIGWPWHQTQQRGIGIADSEINRRQAEVSLIYTHGLPEGIDSILDKYDVGYVLVGQTERLYYDPDGVAALEANPRLHLVYEDTGEHDPVRIYKVV